MLSLLVAEGAMVGDVEPPATMPMSNKRSSSKSMSSNRCGETHVTHLNTLKVDMVVDLLHGRVCTTMSRSLWLLQTPGEADGVDSRRAEATEDQHHRRLIQPRLLQLTLQRDQRMLASQGRIIV